MCILSDVLIWERIKGGDLRIDPLSKACVGPDSVDLHLSDVFLVHVLQDIQALDLSAPDGTPKVRLQTDCFTLHPRMVVTAYTVEYVALPSDLIARVDGRSSLARCGLQIASAVLVHAGWAGYLALELVNLAGFPLVLRSGLAVCQISFEELSAPAAVPYGDRVNRYHNQERS